MKGAGMREYLVREEGVSLTQGVLSKLLQAQQKRALLLPLSAAQVLPNWAVVREAARSPEGSQTSTQELETATLETPAWGYADVCSLESDVSQHGQLEELLLAESAVTPQTALLLSPPHLEHS
jgi:hypothetical protein